VKTSEFEASIKESKEFIESCDLSACDHAGHVSRRLAAFDVDPKEQEGFVAGDVVVAITAGMSKKNKQIMKDTMLYATLAANSKFPQGGVDWYRLYTKVLSYCGWFSQSSGFSDYRTSNGRFTMDQVALQILESAIVSAALPVSASMMLLKVAKDTVQALQENDEPLRLFESKSKTHTGAKFAIASAAESGDGELVVAMAALDFNTQLDVTNVLFWEWSNSSVRIKRAENHLTLNHGHYERVKSGIEAQLADKALQALMEFEI
jgi:hypothetical protein